MKKIMTNATIERYIKFEKCSDIVERILKKETDSLVKLLNVRRIYNI